MAVKEYTKIPQKRRLTHDNPPPNKREAQIKFSTIEDLIIIQANIGGETVTKTDTKTQQRKTCQLLSAT